MGDSMSPTDPATNPTLLLTRLQHWRMAFFGLVILLAGVAIGAGVTLIWMGRSTEARGEWDLLHLRSPEARAEPGARLLPSLRKYLALDDQQMQAIAPVVKEHMANLQRLRQEVHPKIVEELRLMDSQIAAVLRPDQKRLWDRRFRRLQDDLQWQVGPRRGRAGRPEGLTPPLRRQGPPASGPSDQGTAP
jgi:hypothetical protein